MRLKRSPAPATRREFPGFTNWRHEAMARLHLPVHVHLDLCVGKSNWAHNIPSDLMIGVDLDRKRLSDHEGRYFPLYMDARAVADHLISRTVDLVTFFDAIEHLPKADGLALLREMEQVARQQIMLFIPVESWGEEEEAERLAKWDEGLYGIHLSTWHPDEMADLGYEVLYNATYHRRSNRTFGAMFCWRNLPSELAPMTLADFEQLERDVPYYRGRWPYLEAAIGLLEGRTFQSALELGPYMRPLFTGSDVMDISPRVSAARYVHDATVTPWPVADGQYDLFVGLQVWEHLSDRQVEAFAEVRRIARTALLSFPLNWNTPGDPVHHGITEERIAEWTHQLEPTAKRKVGSRVIYLFDFEGASEALPLQASTAPGLPAPEVAAPARPVVPAAKRVRSRRPSVTPPTSYPPRASIVVLTFNACAWTAACLESLFAQTQTPYELILVDNGSDPETVEVVRSYEGMPGVTVILNEENRGFAAGNNQALERARGEVVVFLNSDTLVTPGWLSNLMRVLDRRPEVAAVGPRSNHASGVQGCIYLRSLKPQAIESFAAQFNWSDESRWLETDTLSGYALAVRRSVLEELGGFDERFAVGTAEDRELCERIRAAGHRLVCAGDTFIFHAGHVSFLENGLNFAHQNAVNRNALLSSIRPRAKSRPLPADSVIALRPGFRYVIRSQNGSVVAHPIAQADAAALLSYPEAEGWFPPEALVGVEIGEPVFFLRSAGPEVFLYAFGRRHVLRGDTNRIARLRGISVVWPEQLEAIPAGEPIAIDDKLPSARERPRSFPLSPMRGFERRFLGTRTVANRIGEALELGLGLAIVRLGSGEAIVLNGGLYEINPFETDYSGAQADDEEFRWRLVEAIRAADIVGLSPNRDVEHCAPLLERLFDDLALAPRDICSAFVNWDLLGIDRDSGGRQPGPALLDELLAGRRVALVGRLAQRAYERRHELGFEITVACPLEGAEGIDPAFDQLAARRDDYDCALVAAGIPAVVLCTRLARELDRVAIDFGHSLNYLLNPLFNESTLLNEKLRWRLDRYLETLNQPPVAHSPYEGRFVQDERRSIFYVERGRLRHVRSKGIVEALGEEIIDVRRDELAGLYSAIPLILLVDEVGGAFLLKDGTKVPVDLGSPILTAKPAELGHVPTVDRRLRLELGSSASSSTS